jgi:hypothetical protein
MKLEGQKLPRLSGRTTEGMVLMLIPAKCRQLTRLVSDADGYVCDILHYFGDTIQKFTYY